MPVRFHYGTAGNDTLVGTRIKDAMHGREGRDTLWGLDGYDRLFGDAGDDRLAGGKSGDDMRGGEGDDRLKGGRGDDFMYGDQGRDELLGGDGDDSLYGGTGEPDAHRDLLHGDEGDDELDLDGTGAIRDKGWGGEGADEIRFQGQGAVGYGQAGDDRFQVTTAPDAEATGFIFGGAGADELFVISRLEGRARVTFADWQAGVDTLAGRVVGDFPGGAMPTAEFVRQTFDVNGDGHVDVGDGDVRAGPHSLTFSANPGTGDQALTLELNDYVLYLPHSDALL